MPYAKNLEAAALVNDAKIEAAALSVLGLGPDVFGD